MAEWSAVAAAAAMLLMAGAMFGMMTAVRRVLFRTEETLGKLEREVLLLSQNASAVLDQTSASLSSLKTQLAAGESIAVHLNEAAASAAAAAEEVHSITRRASETAIEHLERARLDNERTIGEVFRWMDAGMTVWHAWQRRAPKSGGGQSE